MFYLCREKNKTLFWANKALFYRLRKRNANRNIKKTASSRNFWICREYAFCLRIWSRLCMRMRRPVQDGLYCESLWNPAVTESGIFSASSFRWFQLPEKYKFIVYRVHTIFKHETNKNITFPVIFHHLPVKIAMNCAENTVYPIFRHTHGRSRFLVSSLSTPP